MKPLSQINVIPFVDVMLVLLAVVLMTATFVAQGKIPVTIPEASESEALPAATVLEIAIDRSGVVYVDGIEKSLESLAKTLRETAPETPVVLRVDGNSAFEHFVAVVDRLKARQMENLSIVTRTPAG